MVAEFAAEKIAIRTAGSRLMLTTNRDIFLRKSLISPSFPRAKRISKWRIVNQNVEDEATKKVTHLLYRIF